MMNNIEWSMRNMEFKQEKVWGALKGKIKEIEEYYGIELSQHVKSEVHNLLINDLFTSSHSQTGLPRQIYARCIDGKIRQGHIDDTMTIELLSFRDSYDKQFMTKELWEQMMTHFDVAFVYCFDNKRFYNDIDETVGRYLMNHECSSLVYEAVHRSHIKLPEPFGETAVIFDKFLKMHKSIIAKKDLLEDTAHEMGLRVKDVAFPYKYVVETLKEQELKIVKEKNIIIDVDNQHYYEERCKNVNILFWDFIHRIRKGMDEEQALELGLEESEKYGFCYVSDSKTKIVNNFSVEYDAVGYNLMKYIQYLSKQEDGIDVIPSELKESSEAYITLGY